MVSNEVSILQEINGEWVVSCPFCKERHYKPKDEPQPEFLSSVRWDILNCKSCNRRFDVLFKPHHLPWLNQVNSATRTFRIGQTGQGEDSMEIDWFKYLLDGIVNLDYKFQKDRDYHVRIDIRDNPHGIKNEYNELIFRYKGGKSVIPHFFSDDPKGAVTRFVEMNPSVEPTWGSLIHLHAEMGFSNGFPLEMIENLSPGEVLS